MKGRKQPIAPWLLSNGQNHRPVGKEKKMRVSHIAVLLAFGCLCAEARGGNSGGYRGPNRNGIYPATGLLAK